MIKINPYTYINRLGILFFFTVIPSFNFAQQISYDESFAESGKLLLDDGGSQISILQENSEGDIFTLVHMRRRRKVISLFINWIRMDTPSKILDKMANFKNYYQQTSLP